MPKSARSSVDVGAFTHPEPVAGPDVALSLSMDDVCNSPTDECRETMMSWLWSNWIWIAVLGGMLLMHLRHARGHGAHAGMHGGRGAEHGNGSDAHEHKHPDGVRGTRARTSAEAKESHVELTHGPGVADENLTPELRARQSKRIRL
jgi:hypothetical protein